MIWKFLKQNDLFPKGLNWDNTLSWPIWSIGPRQGVMQHTNRKPPFNPSNKFYNFSWQKKC